MLVPGATFTRELGEERQRYVPLRHARVVGDPDVIWVVVARWSYEDGSTEWALEYWDKRNEAGPDAYFDSEEGAMGQAADEFGIGADDWRDGPQPAADWRDGPKPAAERPHKPSAPPRS
jgi:hypothetical protein